MEPPGRRYLCAACRAAVLICSHCDRGQRYCSGACAQEARQCAVRAAGQRYQRTRRGAHAHAERQRRYRERQQKVTHQGSPTPGPPVLLLSHPIPHQSPPNGAWQCHFCGRELSLFVRHGFLRCRIRRRHPSTDRRTSRYGPVP